MLPQNVLPMHCADCRLWRHLQVLTACNLASFSLVDCMQSLLGRTLEVLPANFVGALAGLCQHDLVTGAVPACLPDNMKSAMGNFQPCLFQICFPPCVLQMRLTAHMC